MQYNKTVDLGSTMKQHPSINTSSIENRSFLWPGIQMCENITFSTIECGEIISIQAKRGLYFNPIMIETSC